MINASASPPSEISVGMLSEHLEPKCPMQTDLHQAETSSSWARTHSRKPCAELTLLPSLSGPPQPRAAGPLLEPRGSMAQMFSKQNNLNGHSPVQFSLFVLWSHSHLQGPFGKGVQLGRSADRTKPHWARRSRAVLLPAVALGPRAHFPNAHAPGTATRGQRPPSMPCPSVDSVSPKAWWLPAEQQALGDML